MKVDLNGQVAVVTGAARHIGRAIADALAANGALVVYTDVQHAELQEAAAASPGEAHAAAMDVTDEAQVAEVVTGVAQRFGRLDILVNNAGINTMRNRVTIDRFPREEWQRILDVDLTGLYLVSKSATGVMLGSGRGGRIVEVTNLNSSGPGSLRAASELR